MLQKLSLLSSSRQNTSQIDQSWSISTDELSSQNLINKIVQLQAQLYQSHIENQDLRQKRNILELELDSKKKVLSAGTSQTNKVKIAKKSYKHQRNFSQPTIEIEKQFQNEINMREQREKDKNIRLCFNSPNKQFITPITVFEKEKETYFKTIKTSKYGLKNTPIETPQLGQSQVTNLSSPRAIGIKKNITKSSKMKTVVQNQENIDKQFFKSIEQIWNGTKKTESFLQKGSLRSSHKKTSYLTKS